MAALLPKYQLPLQHVLSCARSPAAFHRRDDAPEAPSHAAIASFKSFAARNATFLLALILIASPVAGLRPMRAARFLTCKIPSPAIRMRSPFLRCLVMRATRRGYPAYVYYPGPYWGGPYYWGPPIRQIRRQRLRRPKLTLGNI